MATSFRIAVSIGAVLAAVSSVACVCVVLPAILWIGANRPDAGQKMPPIGFAGPAGMFPAEKIAVEDTTRHLSPHRARNG